MPEPKKLLKKLSQELERIKIDKFQSNDFKSVNIYFQDESRFGLRTIQRRVLTIKGVKPLITCQQGFKNFYLYGAYSPITGTHFTLELPKCNTDWFQAYLDEFTKVSPEELKILILDNGSFHKGKELIVPQNIALLFLPPYCPELNPAERMWEYIKETIANETFKTLAELSDRLAIEVNKLTNDVIKSITSYQYYINYFHAVF